MDEIFDFELAAECDVEDDFCAEEQPAPVIKKEKHWKSEKLKQDKGIAS